MSRRSRPPRREVAPDPVYGSQLAGSFINKLMLCGKKSTAEQIVYGFEALTLVQTRKVAALPIVLFGEEYWRRVIDFDALVEEGTIDREDLELFVFAEKADEAWNYIKFFFKTGVNGNGVRHRGIHRVAGTAFRTGATRSKKR